MYRISVLTSVTGTLEDFTIKRHTGEFTGRFGKGRLGARFEQMTVDAKAYAEDTRKYHTVYHIVFRDTVTLM